MYKAYDSKLVEDKIYKIWEKSGFFNPDKLSKKLQVNSKIGLLKSYCIVLPPPNVTGNLHMGHALNATIQDILIRKKRMQGYKTLWLPGTDHAGIATQNVVEKKLKKENKNRHNLGRENFIKLVWEWKKEYGNNILKQLKKLGASCDWSRKRFTMDKNYANAVEKAFIYYYKKKWIYKGERVVNWCKRCQTSLSDLELEYEEEKSKLWHIRYPLKLKIKNKKLKINYIVIATTRPETMLGDSAIAVNPKDARYKNLIGTYVILPILNRAIPIISDRSVDMKFGTGAIKVTPAHDILDSLIGEKNKLPIYKVINQLGKITKIAGKKYEGLSTKDAREKIVIELEKQNLIEKIVDYNHRVSKCYRCSSTIEPLLSNQWFLKMDELSKKARNAAQKKEISFHPKNWEKVYIDWLNNIRDWCISRQLWWGHRIPVYFCQNKKEKLKIKNCNFIVSEKKPKKCPVCKKCEMKQSEDVLDTWFSSALWPIATLGWPNKNAPDLKKFYPTQVLATSRDIINLWVTRMIFSGIEFTGKKPFTDIIIHPTILTRDGKRMSKSLGTGIDPEILIEKYGADATRFGLIYQMMGGQNIHFSEDSIIAGKKFANKLWNIIRFININLENSKIQITNYKFKSASWQTKLSKKDKEILKKLYKTIESVNQDIDKYKFGQALHNIYDFVWRDFADKYIEYSKTKNTDEVKQVLLFIVTNIIKLLHPFMPFITEEIWNKLKFKEQKGLLMVSEWPKSLDNRKFLF